MKTYNCDRCGKQVDKASLLIRFYIEEEVLELCEECMNGVNKITIKHQDKFDKEMNKYLGLKNVNNKHRATKG